MTPVPIVQKTGMGPKSPSGCFGEEKKISDLSGIEPGSSTPYPTVFYQLIYVLLQASLNKGTVIKYNQITDFMAPPSVIATAVNLHSLLSNLCKVCFLYLVSSAPVSLLIPLGHGHNCGHILHNSVE
jgi:hypothetical protein